MGGVDGLEEYMRKAKAFESHLRYMEKEIHTFDKFKDIIPN